MGANGMTLIQLMFFLVGITFLHYMTSVIRTNPIAQMAAAAPSWLGKEKTQYYEKLRNK